VFVPGKHFQTSLMFAIKARAYLAWCTWMMLHSKVGYWPYPQSID